MFTLQQLVTIMPQRAYGDGTPGTKATTYYPLLAAACQRFDITTPLREAAFLAQVAHESAELYYMQEQASGEAYEGRQDLGNTDPGDGPRFKGRGPIQITGRYMYRRCGQSLGMDLEAHPELLERPENGFLASAWLWTDEKHLNAAADAGDFDLCTKRINGGFNGKASRDGFYAKAKQVLGIQSQSSS